MHNEVHSSVSTKHVSIGNDHGAGRLNADFMSQGLTTLKQNRDCIPSYKYINRLGIECRIEEMTVMLLDGSIHSLTEFMGSVCLCVHS